MSWLLLKLTFQGFFRHWFQELWRSSVRDVPRWRGRRPVALSSVLLCPIFLAAHKHLVLGYFYLLFIMHHGTKSCPGTENNVTDVKGWNVCNVSNKPLGGDRRLVLSFQRPRAVYVHAFPKACFVFINDIMSLHLLLERKAVPLLRLSSFDADLAHGQLGLSLRSTPGNHCLNPLPHVLPQSCSLPAQLQKHQVS